MSVLLWEQVKPTPSPTPKPITVEHATVVTVAATKTGPNTTFAASKVGIIFVIPSLVNIYIGNESINSKNSSIVSYNIEKICQVVGIFGFSGFLVIPAR
ncbi:unnamed protein product [Adineta steineri]|uniref:Uncharacterized protein n=1 Tax=Adineta steineri TaxID=433720 RepID=A0A818UKC4_9BILA|nr:unnamed protein product [Adineta steineri]CAF3702378.1 unnamed protein product [Adineta steineri]